MSEYVVAIDQGTTSTRSIVFDQQLRPIASAQQEFTQHFPDSGWVEHDAEDLFNTTVSTFRAALGKANLHAEDIASIGITNQRETVVLWDKNSGKPVHHAIVWQDRRTADFCASLKAQGLSGLIQQKTGLLADPYFSGTKVRWLLNNVDGLREQVQAGNILMGTVDTWLVWKLTAGKVHATDATNASRTLFYNIRENQWDQELLEILDVPANLLPQVKDCAADYGRTDAAIFGAEIPICGIAGDQHAATIGQACFQPGMLKSTYGTGCFALMNTGDEAVTSQHNLLTTLAYQLNGKAVYALEGSIFIAGAAVQWLRDGIKIIDSAGETQQLAESADPQQKVYLVPAFVGLAAPYWDPDARGAVFGLTRNSGPSELARAALESVGYQTRDLLSAMHADAPGLQNKETILRVDGGMTASDWTMQFLADILDSPVDRPVIAETTALGAAYLAGLQLDLYPQPDEFANSWALDHRFEPTMDNSLRDEKYSGWQDAVVRTLTNAP